MVLQRLFSFDLPRWRTAFLIFLVACVLPGGILPALYGPLLPHAHVFLGGPPPVNWEQHEHPSLLSMLAGQPSAVSLTNPRDNSTSSTSSSVVGTSLHPGKVVSLYDGTFTILIVWSTIAVLVPALLTPILAPRVGPVRVWLRRCIQREPDLPLVPPPRQLALI